MDTLTPEQRIQLAIKAFQSGSFPSKRSAASAFNIPWSTFRDRLAGVQTNNNTVVGSLTTAALVAFAPSR